MKRYSTVCALDGGVLVNQSSRSLLKNVWQPLPLVAAQNRHSAFIASHRAATKGSGI